MTVIGSALMSDLGKAQVMVVGDDIALDPREILRLHVLYLERRNDLDSDERRVFGRYLEHLSNPVLALAKDPGAEELK